MSIFAVGGNLGLAIGPALALALVTSFGMKGISSMVLLGILMTVILFFNISMLTTPVKSAHREAKGVKAPLSKDQIMSFSLLVAIATVRAWIQFGLATYIPFYYINYLKGDPLYAGKLVSTFLMAGVLGTLLGAPLADRWGHKKLLLTTLILSFPLLLLFYYTLFHYGSGLMAFILLGAAGMVLISTFALTTVMGQALLPQNLGMASGMMVGFTISAGGLGVTVLGMIADAWGVPVAIKAIFALPLVAFGLTLLVKYPLEKKIG
jgi:FSR family fosmidomycin resistance protein-like MFS transporter